MSKRFASCGAWARSPTHSRGTSAGRTIRGPVRERHEPDWKLLTVVVLLAAIGILGTSRRKDRDSATGKLSRETRRRDAGGMRAPQTLSGKDYERSVALARSGKAEIEPVTAKPPAAIVRVPGTCPIVEPAPDCTPASVTLAAFARGRYTLRRSIGDYEVWIRNTP